MRQRLILLLSVVMLFSSLLVGCNRSSMSVLSPKSPTNIVVWTYYNGEQRKAFEEMVTNFNNTIGHDHGVFVESVSKADVNTLNTQVLSSARGEPNAAPLPNIFFSYVDIAYDLYKLDLLKPFNDYLSPQTMDSFVPNFLAEGRIAGNDNAYILPVAKSSEVIAINKTLFEEFANAVNANGKYGDVSMDSFKSWEGIVHASETYRKWIDDTNDQQSAEMKAMFGVDSVANLIYSVHRQLDAPLFNVKDGNAVIDFTTVGMNRLWDTYSVPMINGSFAAFGRYRSDDFRTGGILAFLGSSTSASYISEEIVDQNGHTFPIELAIMPMPVFDNGRPVAIQQGAGMALVKSNEKQEAACALFAEWFTRPEQNIRFARSSAYIPVTTQAIDELIAKLKDENSDNIVDRMLLVSLEQVSSGYEMYTPPVFTGSYQVRLSINDHLNESIEHARSSAEPIDNDELLKRYIEQCVSSLNAAGIETIS